MVYAYMIFFRCFCHFDVLYALSEGGRVIHRLFCSNLWYRCIRGILWSSRTRRLFRVCSSLSSTLSAIGIRMWDEPEEQLFLQNKEKRRQLWGPIGQLKVVVETFFGVLPPTPVVMFWSDRSSISAFNDSLSSFTRIAVMFSGWTAADTFLTSPRGGSLIRESTANHLE